MKPKENLMLKINQLIEEIEKNTGQIQSHPELKPILTDLQMYLERLNIHRVKVSYLNGIKSRVQALSALTLKEIGDQARWDEALQALQMWVKHP